MFTHMLMLNIITVAGYRISLESFLAISRSVKLPLTADKINKKQKTKNKNDKLSKTNYRHVGRVYTCVMHLLVYVVVVAIDGFVKKKKKNAFHCWHIYLFDNISHSILICTSMRPVLVRVRRAYNPGRKVIHIILGVNIIIINLQIYFVSQSH